MKLWKWIKNLFKKPYTAGEVPKSTSPIHTQPPAVSYPLSYLEKALEITGSFEGNGYGQVTGNGDGQGMSCGILQWCYGQGSLQSKLLRPYIAKYGAKKLDELFPINVSQTANMNPAQAISFAKSFMLDGTSVKPSFKMAWRALLLSPEMIEIQKAGAHNVAEKAWKLCYNWNMPSIKAFCWFFDVVTQNGSIEIDIPYVTDSGLRSAINDASSKNASIWKFMLPDVDAESKLLLIASHRRAKTANQRWFHDVFDRKGTIAMGRGAVHGKICDFREEFRS